MFKQAVPQTSCVPTSSLSELKRKQQNMSFAAVSEAWLNAEKARYKISTESKYVNLLYTHILPTMGQLSIKQISVQYIDDFLKAKTICGRLDGQGGLSASYVRSIMLLINSILKFAQANRFRSDIPLAKYRPAIEKPAVEVLSLDEQKRLEDYLLAQCTPSELGVFLALQAGLRIGEVCALAWEDVDIPKRLLHIRHTVLRVPKAGRADAEPLCLGRPKTKTSLRTIPLHSRLADILEQAYAMRSSDFVASTKPGFVSPRTFDYRYHRILERSRIASRNFHVLRHTFATRCIEAGVDIKTLSELLGHANTSVTLNTYVHSSLELKRSQLERMTTYINRSTAV